ncbi:right-handed parallel beta-helix repeat-containing protein [Sphingobium estronivorans]|uniref:right-handed parallel beta-helix repeat-containing protein n=1 Tax=Sphingobium estronivorans TaxID=1577690 RepID=UPI00123A3B75|nr:right-handed parallel beta-helix repeat-containing protein [Sphingobium estronivorans]
MTRRTDTLFATAFRAHGRKRIPVALAAGGALLTVTGLALTFTAVRMGDWGNPVASALANAIAPAVIDDAASLTAALRRARGGETLLLEPGRYEMLNLKGIGFARPVTLASRDPRRPAVLTGFKFRNVEGLVLRDLEFDVVAANGMFSYDLTGCANIELRRINVHGSLDGNPANDTSPIMIRGSSHVTVADSDFQELFHGISFLESRNLTFTGNAFRDLRTDGIRGGGSSHLLISGNVFTAFKPAPKDHPDGIQLWTTNTTAAARDIVIEGNVVMRGKGDPIQGIFIRDTFDQFPFEELTVRNNLVVGAMYNGISIGGSKGAVVENNRVVAFAGQKSWIRVGIATGMRMTDNRATAYIVPATAQVEQKGNRTIGVARDGGRAALADWLAQGSNARLMARPLAAAGLR